MFLVYAFVVFLNYLKSLRLSKLYYDISFVLLNATGFSPDLSPLHLTA